MSPIQDFSGCLSTEWLATFVLVLARMGGLVGLAPSFASTALPLSARAALSAALTLLILPAQRHHVALPPVAVDLVLLCVREAAIGALMGVSIAALVSGVRAAGQVVEQQIGLALGEMFDPNIDQNDAVLRQFYRMVAIVLFLLIGGHRMVVRALLDSFDALPAGQSGMPESVVAAAVTLVGQGFQIALRVAAPVVVTLLLVGAALGFLARTAPQIQSLVTALPIRALVGLFVLAAALVGVVSLVNEQACLFLATLSDSLERVTASGPQ